MGASIEVSATLVAVGVFIGAEHITGGWALQLSSGFNNAGFGVAWNVGYYDGGLIAIYPGINGALPGTELAATIDYESMVAGVNEVSRNIENYYPPNMPAVAPLYIFCTASYNPSSGNITAKRFLAGKIRNVKTWNQSGAPTRDFVPVLDADGTPCMYDKISRTCFYNQGTGTFGYRVKTTGAESAPMSLRDPYYTAPTGIYARSSCENQLEILADTEETTGDGWEWFANTAEAYEHFGIPQEELLTNDQTND